MTKYFEEKQYVVAFLDVVGESEKLSKATKKVDRYERYWRIKRFRGHILSWYKERAQSNQGALSYPKGIPPTVSEIAEQIRKKTFEVITISDSILIYAPYEKLDSGEDYCPIYDIFTAISAVALLSHFDGVVFRGAIELGYALDMAGGIYGPVLEKVKSLERVEGSENPPRIKIGSQLYDKLQGTSNGLASRFPLGGAVHGIESKSKSLITLDHTFDNHYILDYLCDDLMLLYAPTPDKRKVLIRCVYEGLCNESAKPENGDYQSKYNYLKKYYEYRAKALDIDLKQQY